MKRKRFLSALVIGALVGAMTVGTTNPVKAATDVTINGSGTGGSNTWTSGYADSDGLHVSGGGNSDTYTYWTHKSGDSGDTLTMTGGSLTIYGLPNGHDPLYASDGNITVSSGPLSIKSGSYISNTVNLAVNSSGTLNISGGSVGLNSGDSISGTINATSGSLTVSGGDHTLNNDSVIGSSVNFAVTGGTLRFSKASTLQKSFTNAGNLWFYSGTQDDNITNTANTTIHFVGANNSGNLTGGTENVVFTNNTSSSVTSESNSGSIAARNLYVGESSSNIGNFTNNGTISTTGDVGVRSGSSFTNKNGKSLTVGGSLNTASGAYTTIENADDVSFTSTSGKYVNDGSLTFKGGAISKAVSGSGTTYIGTGTVTNNSAISQAVNVSSGTFNNATGGSVTGLTTVGSSGTLNNTAGTLANVTNNGILSVSGGSTNDITNNKSLSISGGTVASVNNADATNSSVTQTGGSVTNNVTNTGSYTISGGSIGGTVTNTGTLNISTTGTIGGVTNSASGALGASQSNGTVTTLSNSGKYSQSGGTVTTANNTGTYNLSGTGSTITNYSQSAGSLTVDGGASLTITDSVNGITGSTNAITGGEVNLGSSVTSLGNLTINNGATNTAKVVTTGGSGLNIQNGTLTTSTGTNIGNGAAVTIGTASGTTGTLNVTNGTVALGTNDNWNAKGAVNVNGGTLNLNGVTQTGTLSQTSGTTNIAAAQTLGTGASITGGTLNVDNDLTLTGGTITAGDGFALVSIDSGKTLDIQGGTVTLDGGSGTHGQVDWNGTVKLESGGTLILSNIYDTSRTTTETKNKTGILNAEGGNLTINSSTVLLGNNDIIAKAVNLTLAGDIVVDSGANAYIDSSDNWTVGNITQTGGTLSLDGVSTAAGKTLNSDGGILNVINTVTLATGADTIATGTTVNIASGNTLDIDNTATAGVTIDSGDTWAGNIKLDGGNLTLKDRTTEDVTTATKTYNQTAGTLTLNNSKLKLGTTDSIINGTSAVDITNNSTLTLSNASANQAKVTMNNTGSSLILNGTNTAFTTLTDSNLSAGTVTIGDGSTASTFNLSNNGIIADAVTLTVAKASKLNVNGAAAQATINTGDTWNGAIEQSAGTVTHLNNVVKNATDATYKVTGGNVKIGDGTTAGTLTLNNSADSIATAAAVTIYGDSKLAQSAGTVVLDNTNDTWDGAIELSGTGDLTLSGRSDTTTATKTYNQSGGKLTIDNGGSLTLNTADSKINGTSEVVLGEATNNTAGTLVVNNGLTTNQAKVTTAGTSTSNAFSVTAANTAFTTLTGTDFEVGSVTVGDGTNASVLNLSNNGIIADAVTLTVAKASKLNVNGATAQATINTGDTWNGAIEQSAGTVTHLNNVVKNATDATYKVTGGNVNIGDGTTAGTLTLNNAADSIAKAANVTIYGDSKLAQSAGTVILDNTTDIWDGAIELSSIGNLTLEGFTKTTDGTIKYNQTGGKATLDNTDLELAYNATAANTSSITDGSVTLTNGSTLTLSNELTNSAAVNMAAATETLNVINNSMLTVGNYTYDPTGINQLIETSIDAGTLNIGNALDNTDHSTLEVASGLVDQNANVNIFEGSLLDITGADAADASATTPAIIGVVTLDGTDNWSGDINLSNIGSADNENVGLILTGVNKTTGANPTFNNSGTMPYYSQTGGSLALTNKTTLSMTDSSKISGGNLGVDTDSTFNSLSNAFSVNKLANAGLINGINGGYENYAVSTSFYAGDALGDNQGDFTTDLYARCDTDNNFRYDSYGSDSATIYASDPSKYGILNVSDWRLNGDIFGWDAPIDRSYNLDKLFKGSVAAGHTIDFTSTNKEVFTPIGWYGLHSRGGGNYSFDLNRYNPGVFRGQVTTVAQYQNQLMIDDMLFNHTMLDQGFKGNDYISSNPNRLASANDLYPPYQYSRKDGGVWVKMYGTFEHLNMNQGLSVGNNAYGTLIGVDFGLKDLKHGWQFMPTAYIGYNGAHQYWDGYGAYQNGGQAGVMGTWYKNNFMIGALAYGGVYGNDMSTPRGDDNAFNYFAGGSVKTAYNWRFAKNWALQPNLMVAYNFFGQQNWHTDFGQMGMMSGMLNGINIAPGLNLIWEKETFSIYGTIQYMYNINQASGGRAGHVYLPNVHMNRGYIQYGLGINKKFSDRFSGYLQAVIRNVGRTGVGLQAGFQWQLGKGSSNNRTKKGNVTPELKKTEIKVNGNKVQ